MSFKCLIVDDLHPSFKGLFADLGIQVHYDPTLSRAAIKKILPEYSGLIIRSKTTVDSDLCAKANNLKFVARAGAGIDKLDVAYLETRGIEIINAPEGNRDAVGDHTLALILSLLNNIHSSYYQVKDMKWLRQENRGYELNAMTVGLYGFGNTGREVAKRLSGFGCKILVYDKYIHKFNVEYVEGVEEKQLLKEADIISFHIPLTDETRGMINRDFIENASKPFYVINTSRGEILNQSDLYEGMLSGKIRGAGLDVLENESLNSLDKNQKEAFNKLISLKNTVITPHIAGWSRESYERINKVLYNKIKVFLRNY